MQMMTTPLVPLMRNTFLNEAETRKALSEFILTADRLSMDKECGKFEQKFARHQGRRHAVLFNSGGSANLALLQALKNIGKLKEGDRVGFSALTWSTNTMPIIQMGLVPVAVDCDPLTLNVMSYTLEERLKQTSMKALFITNVLGFLGDLNKIRSICQERGMILIEDNCESLGSALPEGKAGNFGVASTFSFFVAHHMSTIEGGMICSDDDDLSEMLRIVRANGWDRNLTPEQQVKWRRKFQVESEFQSKYTFYDLGFNLRPTEITGFLGQYQLQFLDETIRKRQENFLRVEAAIKKNKDLHLLQHSHQTTVSTFAFPIVCKDVQRKPEYLERFMSAGIEVRPMIAGNIQKQPFYAKYVTDFYDLPGTDLLHYNGFYCGNYPELTDEDLDTIIGCII